MGQEYCGTICGYVRCDFVPRTEGAIEAANRGYDAVMSPGEIIYFDWYQANPHTQPQAMSGFSPIKKMYSFEPCHDTPGLEIYRSWPVAC